MCGKKFHLIFKVKSSLGAVPNDFVKLIARYVPGEFELAFL